MRERIVAALREAAELPADGRPARIGPPCANARARGRRAGARPRARLAPGRASGAACRLHDRRVLRVARAPGAARDGPGLAAALRGTRRRRCIAQAAREALAAAAADDAAVARAARASRQRRRARGRAARRDAGQARPVAAPRRRGATRGACASTSSARCSTRSPASSMQVRARCSARRARGARALRRATRPPISTGTAATALAAALARCVRRRGGLPPAHWQQQDDWRALANWLLVKRRAAISQVDRRARRLPAQRTGAGRPNASRASRRSRRLLRSARRAGRARRRAARRAQPAAAGLRARALGDRRRAARRAAAGRGGARAGVRRARASSTSCELTLAALRALGAADAPTDLLLRLDARYDHLLVDEFQDTSDVADTSCWRASPRAGPTATAARCSRSAIRCSRSTASAMRRCGCSSRRRQTARIGNVAVRVARPHPQLPLAGSHRATGSTTCFRAVLAPRSDPWRGAVAFAPAVATRAAHPRCTANARPRGHGRCRGRLRRPARDSGAGGATPPTSRSWCARARHLDRILPALRAARIPFAAVDLDALGTRQSMLDLTSLAHALVQPADRLASLAVLRAPWCGLVLADLLAVSAHVAAGLHDGPRRVITTSRTSATTAMYGSIASPRRCCRRLPSAGRVSFSACVRGAWLALGGPATVDEAIDLDAAARFFALLAAHEAGGDIRDWNRMLDALAVMYPTPATGSAARVQVMTLHHAKGLEFDTVILPGLARGPKGERPRPPALAHAAGRPAAGADQGARRRRGSGLRLPRVAGSGRGRP